MPPPPHASSSKDPSGPAPILLTNQTMLSFKPAKVFTSAVEQGSMITSITFDDLGENCVTSGDDDAFKLWNCRTGKETKTFYSKKYGIDHVRYTHGKTNLLHASTRINDDIRYHSLHDNRYLCYFTGHTDKVIALAINPVNDGFISSSLDGTIRLWDIRTPHCRGRLDLGSGADPIVCYDNQGLVFAVAENAQPPKIHMFDSSNFDAGPFTTFDLIDPQLAHESSPPKIPIITSLSFSPHGKYILVGTSADVHYLIDSFNGQLLKRLVGHRGLGRNARGEVDVTPQRGMSGEEVKWSPDANFVVSGSFDGNLRIWDVQGDQALNMDDETLALQQRKDRYPTLRPIGKVEGLDGHDRPSRAVGFNPRTTMMATGAGELAFWLPERSESTGV